MRSGRGHAGVRVVGGHGVDGRLGQPEGAQRLGGDGAVPREVALGLLGVEVVAQAGEAPDVRVLAETQRRARA